MPLTGELDTALAGTNFEKLPAEFVRGPSGFFENLRYQQVTVTSPDGKLAAQIGSMDGSGQASRSKEYATSAVVIRETATGRVLYTLTGHSADVVSLGFSPDGRRLATASFDRTMKLWDVQTGQDVFTLRGHTAGLVCLAFSPDGNRIVSGGIDFKARVWNATPLPSNVIAEHDARYRKKIEMLSQLKATSDDARRAEILTSGGQWGMAAEAFAKAVEKEPEKLQLRYRLVEALVQAGDRSRIGPACDDILKRFGNSGPRSQGMFIRGLCRLAPQAVTDPEKRQALHEFCLTGDANVLFRILVKYRLWGLTEDAGLGAEILADAGQWGLAAEAFAKAVQKKPENFQLRCELVDALLQAGDRSRVGPACDDILKRFGNNGNFIQDTEATGVCRLAQQAITDPEKRQAVHELAMTTSEWQRALVLGQSGQWDLVASGFTKHVEAKYADDKPEGLFYFGIQLLSLVESGDLPGYRSAAGKLVSRFSKSSDPGLLNNAAWCCTYASDAVADLAVPVQMAEKALAGYPLEQKRFALNTLGAVLYRAGRLDEAIARLDESVKASDGAGVPEDWAFLAMAHHKKGNGDEARRWLLKLRSHKPDEKAPVSSELLVLRILAREAETLFRETPPARP